jgi:hypothetical protein
VANSHSNNQLSFDQSPVAIRHSLPLLSWLFRANRRSPLHYSLLAIRYSLPFPPVAIRQSLFAAVSVVADSHSNNLPVANRHSPFATRRRFHQSLIASRHSPPFSAGSEIAGDFTNSMAQGEKGAPQIIVGL